MSWFDNLNFETILRETGLDGLVEEVSSQSIFNLMLTCLMEIHLVSISGF